MPARSGVIAVAAVAAALALVPAALAQYPPAPAPSPSPQQPEPAGSVDATGNAITGGLGFSPMTVTVAVGGVVRWTNRDSFAPHTATEDHGLWDLAGSYGQTPANPSGFGPGTSVQRAFEAGTHNYYCRVHGREAQHGTVVVPVTLALDRQVVKRRVKARGHRRRRTVRRTVYAVIATWATRAPAAGDAFDVQVARGSGAFQPLRTATTDTTARIPALGRGTVTHVRARLRKATDATIATHWSPDATVTRP
jgi:plastocyanin